MRIGAKVARRGWYIRTAVRNRPGTYQQRVDGYLREIAGMAAKQEDQAVLAAAEDRVATRPVVKDLAYYDGERRREEVAS